MLHIEKRMIASANKILTMKNYGSRIQLIRLYNSLVIGYFSHGLDTLPLLSEKWYSRFQKIICNFLKVITNQTYGIIHRPISQSELLSKNRLKNAYNVHNYLLMNRLGAVFMSEYPKTLFNDLKPCLFQNSWKTKSLQTRIIYVLSTISK